MTGNGTAINRTLISGTTPLTVGQGYDFTLYSPPNGSVIYYRLVNINTGAVIVDSSTSTNIPLNTTFLGPQVTMSNGTANITAGQVAIDVNRIYIESDM